MKHKAIWITVILCLLLLCGCSNTGNRASVSNSKDVNDVLTEQMEKADQETAEPVEENTETVSEPEPQTVEEEPVKEEEPITEEKEETIDVDLTVLSSTMVYGEVFNMVTNPDEYMGKIVKMEGIYYPYHDEEAGIFYNTCVIPDATACCAQGIEFEIADGDYRYDTEDIIQVVGEFDVYYEDETMYCILRNAYYPD